MISGEFISFLDDDDYITPDCIEKLMDILLTNNDIHIVFPRQRYFVEKSDCCIIESGNEKNKLHITSGRYLSKGMQFYGMVSYL